MNAPISHRPTGLISLQDDEDDEDVALVTFGTFDNESLKYPPPPKEAAEGMCSSTAPTTEDNEVKLSSSFPLHLSHGMHPGIVSSYLPWNDVQYSTRMDP